MRTLINGVVWMVAALVVVTTHRLIIANPSALDPLVASLLIGGVTLVVGFAAVAITFRARRESPLGARWQDF